MKKCLNKAMIFAIYGLASGVYFREFTKFNNFETRTMLGMAHPHILMLGMAGYLIIGLFFKVLNIEEDKKVKMANTVYIAGIVVASIMMLVRGTMEVSGMEITKMVSGMISGIAGLGHIAVAAGVVRFINIFKKAA